MASSGEFQIDQETIHFTAEKARCALRDILESIAEHAPQLEEAKENAGNDMVKRMQIVFPLLTQIQCDVIQAYGFTPDGEGAVHFTQAVKSLEREDAEIAALFARLQEAFFPPMTPPPPSQPQGPIP